MSSGGTREDGRHWSRDQKLLLAAVVIAAVTLLVIWSQSRGEGPARPRGHTTTANAGSGSGSGSGSTTTTTTSPQAPITLAHPVYLDVLPETTGGQVTPGQVAIGGHAYKHGVQFEVGTGNETVEASYSIPKGAQTFSTTIGNDDNQPNELWSAIPLLYEVLVDGRRVAPVGHARDRAHDPPLNADVSGGSTITLKITDVHDQTGSTRADWANPVFR